MLSKILSVCILMTGLVSAQGSLQNTLCNLFAYGTGSIGLISEGVTSGVSGGLGLAGTIVCAGINYERSKCNNGIKSVSYNGKKIISCESDEQVRVVGRCPKPDDVRVTELKCAKCAGDYSSIAIDDYRCCGSAKYTAQIINAVQNGKVFNGIVTDNSIDLTLLGQGKKPFRCPATIN